MQWLKWWFWWVFFSPLPKNNGAWSLGWCHHHHPCLHEWRIGWATRVGDRKLRGGIADPKFSFVKRQKTVEIGKPRPRKKMPKFTDELFPRNLFFGPWLLSLLGPFGKVVWLVGQGWPTSGEYERVWTIGSTQNWKILNMNETCQVSYLFFLMLLWFSQVTGAQKLFFPNQSDANPQPCEAVSKRLRGAHKSLLAAVVDRDGFSAKTGAPMCLTWREVTRTFPPVNLLVLKGGGWWKSHLPRCHLQVRRGSPFTSSDDCHAAIKSWNLEGGIFPCDGPW